MKHYLLFLICFLSLQIQSTPQVKHHLAFHHYTIQDGLVQMQVMCSFQDSDGFLWLGTKGGVSRWDGNTFKNYSPEDGFPASQILSISEWNDKIVVVSRNRLTFILSNDRFMSFRFPEGMVYNDLGGRLLSISKEKLMLFSMRNDTTPNFKENSHHLLFDWKCGTFNHVRGFNEAVLSTKGNRIYTYTGEYSHNGLSFRRVCRFPNSNFVTLEHDTLRNAYYFDFRDSIAKYQKNGAILTHEWTIKKDPSVNRMRVLPNGTLFYEGQNEYHFMPSIKKRLYDGISGINDILVDREKNLWLSTEKGLYNFFGLDIEEYTFGLGNPDNIWSVVEDEDRRLWLGSYGFGLWSMTPYNKLMYHSIASYVKPPLFPENHIYQYMGSTKGPGNSVYMNSCVGLSHFSKGKMIEHYSTSVSLYTYYDSTNNTVFQCGHGRDGVKKGVYTIRNKTIQFHPWNLGFPLCMEKDSRGILRIGASNGQGRFTNNQLQVDTATHPYESIICMRRDVQGRLWKGTEKGLFVETVDGKEHWVSKNRKIGGIASMVISNNRYLVLGSAMCFYVADLSLLKDFDSFKLYAFSYESGFTGLSAVQNGTCVGHDGSVWMATSLNVLKFDPAKLVEHYSLPIPNLRIPSLGISVDNDQFQFINLDSVQWSHTKKTLFIDPYYRYLRFDLASNSLSSPKTLQFRYRLKGLTDTWSKPTFVKKIQFMNLGYGSYQLEVQVSLDGVEWSPVVRSAGIQIKPPFWIRPMMLVVYLLLLLMLVVVLTRWITQRKAQKQLDRFQQKKMENELQLKTLRSKVIPHFTKNVLSSIGHFSMTDKLKAGYYISIFSKFTELTMANADKSHISLDEEIQYLRYYLELEKMRFGDRMDYTIDVCSLAELHAQLPPMTLHTYCDNAIRHGLVHKNGLGLLTVKGEKVEGGVLFSITDNGIGRARAVELNTRGNGQGLSLIQSYMEFYNQKNNAPMWQKIIDLTDVDGASLGTRIELFIPDNYTF